MKAIWKGSISFGLVNIPIKLYSAVEESALDLDMLDKKDHSRIRFKRVNESTGKEVSYNEIVRGFKYDGEYIILSQEELEKANPKKTKLIQILEFVNEEDVDSIYFEQPYYIVPEKSAQKSYALLRDAINKTNKVALVDYVLRNKEHLGILKPHEDVLVLNQIRFQEEIRETKDFDLPSKHVKGKELDMAVSLIDYMTKDFEISAYKDTYKKELMKLIESKAKGKRIKYREMEVVPTKVKDLMSQLKASLEKTSKRASL